MTTKTYPELTRENFRDSVFSDVKHDNPLYWQIAAVAHRDAADKALNDQQRITEQVEAAYCDHRAAGLTSLDARAKIAADGVPADKIIMREVYIGGGYCLVPSRVEV